ncbi:phosphonate transporter, partial [Campylobacter concisus]|nr:phosphonate transporter [Campylobacter concisus]
MEKVKNFLESTKVKVAAVGSTLLSAPVLFAGDAPVV